MTISKKDCPDGMSLGLYKAVIAVLSGFSLAEAHDIFSGEIQTAGKAPLAKYNVIRSSLMRLCRKRNIKKYEELAQRDASRPNSRPSKKGAERSADSVHYETLQVNAHFFLLPSEQDEIIAHIRACHYHDEHDCLGTEEEDRLIREHLALHQRASKMLRASQSMGIRKEALINQVMDYLDQMQIRSDSALIQVGRLQMNSAISGAEVRGRKLRNIAKFAPS